MDFIFEISLKSDLKKDITCKTTLGTLNFVDLSYLQLKRIEGDSGFKLAIRGSTLSFRRSF